MDVGMLPARANNIAPVVDDGRVAAGTGDGPAKSGFGSALDSALGDARGTRAIATAAAAPHTMRQNARGGPQEKRALAEAPVLSGSAEQDSSNPAAVVPVCLGPEWPPLEVRPAAAVPAGLGFEFGVESGELAGLEAAVVTGGPEVIVGVPLGFVGLPGGARQSLEAGDPRGFGPRNALGLRPGELWSRLGLAGRDPRPSLSARVGSAESIIAGGPAPEIGTAIAGTLSIVETIAASGDLAATAVGTASNGAPSGVAAIAVEVASNGLAAVAAGAAQHTASNGPSSNLAAIAVDPASNGASNDLAAVAAGAAQNSASSGLAAITPAEAPVLSQTDPVRDTDAAGPRHEMPASDPAALRIQRGHTSALAAEPLGTPRIEGQQPNAGLVDPTQVPGQFSRVAMPADSQAGLRVQPAEISAAGSRDASRVEAHRQMAEAFVSAQQTVGTPSTEAAPAIDAQARLAPTLSADRPLVDRRWTAGPQECVAGSFGEAVRSLDTTAAQSGTSRQSTGRDDANGRGFERRPPADAMPLYAAAMRGAITDFAPERARSVDAVRTTAEPAIAEPTSDGAPLTLALVQSLKFQSRQGGGEARLRLQPDYLGELTVSLRVQGSAVTAVIQCDSANVRTWVEAHQADLRRALEEQGLSLDTITVDPEGHPQQQQEQPQQHDHQPRNWRRGEPGQFEAFL